MTQPDTLPARDDAGLYVHIPFCSAICPYCDFAVLTGNREARRRYVAALTAEVQLSAREPLGFDTIYFGGGTPSALGADDLGAVLGACHEHLSIAASPWISLEANPEDVDATTVQAWRELGVNTVSLGVQSFDDQELRVLGRRHDAQQAAQSVRTARQAGFDVVSVDIIFGLPDQKTSTLRRSLDRAVELCPDHISCYQLTVHEGTPFFAARERGRLHELAEEAQGELYELLFDHLTNSGYAAYEVSNFARSPEARSRHNQKYWDHTPYLGLGLSAHSFDGSRRWWNYRDADTYHASLDAGRRPIQETEQLTHEQLALEAIMLALRTTAGLDLARFDERFGIDLVAVNRQTIDQSIQAGLAEHTGGRLRLTRRGLAVTDAVVRSLSLSRIAEGNS